MGLKFN